MCPKIDGRYHRAPMHRGRRCSCGAPDRATLTPPENRGVCMLWAAATFSRMLDATLSAEASAVGVVPAGRIVDHRILLRERNHHLIGQRVVGVRRCVHLVILDARRRE
jgi:hypothetical protein